MAQQCLLSLLLLLPLLSGPLPSPSSRGISFVASEQSFGLSLPFFRSASASTKVAALSSHPAPPPLSLPSSLRSKSRRGITPQEREYARLTAEQGVDEEDLPQLYIPHRLVNCLPQEAARKVLTVSIGPRGRCGQAKPGRLCPCGQCCAWWRCVLRPPCEQILGPRARDFGGQG